MRILVTDDERDIRQVLKLLLENSGYEVVEASDGAMAVDIIMEDSSIDLCIMDVMMPVLDGVEAAACIRRYSSVPILFLTAKSLESDKEIAYDSGGDDYIVKPYSARELLRKVEALTRRYTSYSAKDLSKNDGIRLAGGVVIDILKREVTKNGLSVDLRDKEIDVLIYLAKHRGQVVSLEDLYVGVWGEMPLASAGNNITVHILNLRKKLEDNPSMPKLIRTVWGKGYQID